MEPPGPPEPYEPDYTTLMHDMMAMTKERDEWKRKAESHLEEYRKVLAQTQAAALQDRELRRALKNSIRPRRGQILVGNSDGNEEARDALALTPTQAEKIVAAMEDICAMGREVKHADAVIGAKFILKLNALDAAKKVG